MNAWPVLVVEVAQTVDGQGAFRRDQPALVVEIPAVKLQRHGAVTQQPSTVLGQALEREGHVTLGRDFTAVAGIQRRSVQVQRALAVDQPGGAVVQRIALKVSCLNEAALMQRVVQ